MVFSWHCPFCNRHTTITEKNSGTNRYEFNYNNKYGFQAIKAHVITCPNPDCREYSLTVTLHDHAQDGSNNYKDLKAKQVWNLIPAAETKIFPDYVPAPIIADYKEACLIRDLSPKASATLSRRCLQGMIRDFWDIKKGRLVDEIDSIKEKIDPVTWAAIDAVRKIGNIGAHMEKDINLIVDVDPNEAKLLISLIETLIGDWYIVREERKNRMSQIVAVAKDKATKKNGNQNPA